MRGETPPEAPSGQRALYLRWRPHSFADVVSQEAVTRTLKNAVVRGTVAHGYLLCGPRGTGKTSLARILYRALNCRQPVDGEPCRVCESCRSVDAGTAMDLIEIDAASNRGIDDIRSLRERVRFAPTEGKWKVYIVDEAHQLTGPAWDAFLKTLEEPPPHTVFVLATTAAHKVPATIVSRCQRFDLQRIPQAQIGEHLVRIAEAEGIQVDREVVERLARLARGGLRDAIGMLEQVAAFCGNPVTLEAARRVLGLVRGDALRSFVDALAQRDGRRAFQVLEDVVQEGGDLYQFLDEVLTTLRSALLLRAGAQTAVDLGADERDWLRGLTQHWAPGEIAGVLRAFAEISPAGVEESQLLIRLELAAAWAVGLPEGSPAATVGAPRAVGPTAESPGAAELPGAVGLPGKGAPTGSNGGPPPPQPSPAPPFLLRGRGEGVLPQGADAGERGLAVREPVPSPAPAADVVRETAPPAEPRHPSSRSLADGEGAPSPGADQSSPLPHPLPDQRPSLATLQARWEPLLSRFPGNLLMKVLLGRVAPVGFDGGVVTLQGRLDRLELQRLEGSRQAVERLLKEEFGLDLPVRFAGAEGAAETPQGPSSVEALADYASTLFGGRVVGEVG